MAHEEHHGHIEVERREHPRFPVNLPVRFEIVDEKEEAQLVLALRRISHAKASNISLGGLCLEAEDALQDGDVLRMVIELPDAFGEVHAFAEVIWSKEKKHGLKFLQLRQGDQKRLEDFLEKYQNA